MKIAVIGTGYVGLVSGVCFANLGFEVICVDKDQSKIDNLKKNISPIFEEGLNELLAEVKSNNKILFTTNLEEALEESEVVFIAVGTPQSEDGSADLSYVFSAAKEIIKLSKTDKVIVTKSTVPAGTGYQIKKIIQETKSSVNFYVASNPEFLREGCAIYDFMNPDRIVVGVENEESKNILLKIYQKFSADKIVITDIITAELIKYASNSFLATKIAFINEIADLCEVSGGNIKEISKAIGLDSRIGEKFLNPGPGFGGSCFPKDIAAILDFARKNQVDLSVINSAMTSNKKRKEKIAEKISAIFNHQISDKKIAFLGLAFKANTDDIRYSPSINIIKKLAKKAAKIFAHDPQAIENSRKELIDFNNVEFSSNIEEVVKDVDLIVISTEWEEYKNIDFANLRKKIKCNKIFDLRNLFDTKKIQSLGFEYFYIGGKNNL